MAFAFDTLAYANHLKKAGVEPTQAEAHAVAARDFIMTELVTKGDLNTSIAAIRQDLSAAVSALRQDMEAQALRLTIRLGGLLVAGIGVLAVMDRLFGP